MLDRSSSLIVALTTVLIGVVIATMAGGSLWSIIPLASAAIAGCALLFVSAKPEKSTDQLPVIVEGPAAIGSLLLHPDFSHWIDQEADPVLGTADNIVTIANNAAISLLGQHIIGADVRTAIRHPAAIDYLSQTDEKMDEQPVNLMDYPRPGQRWTMRIALLSGQQKIIILSDRSAMDAVDRMRSDFVANASHELRTPLAAVLGYVEPLRDMVRDSEDIETQSRFLEIIEREARRMQQLVHDLLSVSRVETDRFRRPTTAADLSSIVEQTVIQLRETEQARASDIQLAIEAGPHPILGDAAQLAQLAHNIITNAMKYGLPGTPVTVELASRQGRIALSVTDVGEGIAPDHLPRLTERFYRVDAARSRSVGGTGLGLAIVKHISERHQGQLNITSELGRGTTVSVSFPPLSEG